MPTRPSSTLTPEVAAELRAAALALPPLPDDQLDAIADIFAQIDLRHAAEGEGA